MITWKQEGSTWVGYIGHKKVFEISDYDYINDRVGCWCYFKYRGETIDISGREYTIDEAKQAAEDFAAEMKELFNTK